MRFTIPVIIEMTDEQVEDWKLTEGDLEASLVRTILHAARRAIPVYYGLVDAKTATHVDGYTWAWELPDEVLAELDDMCMWCGPQDSPIRGIVSDEMKRRGREIPDD